MCSATIYPYEFRIRIYPTLMGLGTPPQPAFGEAFSSEATLQSSDSEPLRTSDAVQEMPPALQRVPSQSDLSTCDAEILSGPLVGDPSELAILFNDGTFNCPLCPTPKVFTNTTRYRSHRNKFHNLPGYTCVVCSSQFDSLNPLVAHMLEKKHSIKCPVPSCSHDFFKPSEAASHYTRRHRAFLCVHCGLPQNGTICYKIHVKTYHSTEGVDFLPASSLVETSLNTSFHDPLSDDQEEQDIQSDTTRDLDSDSVIAEESIQPVAEPFTREIDTDSDITIEHVQPVSELEPGTQDSDGDSVVQIFRNPFHEENVVFGPGAEELFDGPQTPSTSLQYQDNVLWVGHDVSMYQSMSEKHKKIYRYNCGKCSCSFRNKEMFKRHARVHEHICKYCFKKFDSLEDFQTHKKTHSSSKKTLVCQICAHKPTGLKDFMVHEMRHRLNSSFQRKFKDFLKRSPAHDRDLYKCTKCQKLTKGISLGIKHEVWHEWSHLWTTYVTGRIFSKTFKEEDAIRLGRAVEKQLKTQWRDQNMTARSEPNISPSEDLDSVVDEVVDDVMVNDIDSPSNTKAINSDDDEHESTDDENEFSDKESESDTESDYTGEGVKLAIEGWMNFWHSYLGLNDTPPKWVMPILKQLRSKWKQYHMEEQDSLLKEMDQVAFLIRAERNEVLPGEGPRVALKRISIHPSHQKTKCESPSKLPEAKVVLIRMPQNKVKEGILQHMKHQFSLPGTNRKQTVCGVKESCANQSDQESSSSCTPLSNSCNTNTVQRAKTHLVNKDITDAPSGSKAHAIMSVAASRSSRQKRTAIVGPKSRKLAFETKCIKEVAIVGPKSRKLALESKRNKETAIVGPKSRKLALEMKRKRTFSWDPSDIEENDRTSKSFKPSDYSSLKVVSPKSTQVFCKGIGRPVVLLDKLIVPADLRSTFHVQDYDSPESSQCTFREKVNSMINRRVGNKTTPSWLSSVVETVCSNNTLSEKEKLEKILQVDSLLKAELEGTFNASPSVKLGYKDC